MRSEIWRAQALLIANSNEDATATDQWNEEAQRRYDEAPEDVQRTVDEMLARESTSVAYERTLLEASFASQSLEAQAFPTTVRQWLSENEVDESQLAASDAQAEQEEAALIDWAQTPALDRSEAVSITELDDSDREIKLQIALDLELADRRAREAEETRKAQALADIRRGEIADEMWASPNIPAVFKPTPKPVLPTSVIAKA